MLSKYDDWKTANPDDEDHRDDCCAVVNSHWQSPRCNCSELDEEDKKNTHRYQVAMRRMK